MLSPRFCCVGILLFWFDFAKFVFCFVDACICEVSSLVQTGRQPQFLCYEEFLRCTKITESVSSSVSLCMCDDFPGDAWIWVQSLVPDVLGENGFVSPVAVLEGLLMVAVSVLEVFCTSYIRVCVLYT